VTARFAPRPSIAIARMAASIALAVSLVVLTPSPSPAAVHPWRQAAPTQVSVKVLTFNIGGDEWGGWTHRPGSPATAAAMADVVTAIQTSGADVVGVQEPYGRMRELAAALGPGWYSAPRLYLLSRFPIVEPPGADGVWGYIEPVPGEVFAMFDAHLPSYPYGPSRIIKGDPRSAVVKMERRVRVPYVKKRLAYAKPLIAAGVPTFFTGDFNSPSWRDWTKAVIAQRPYHPYPIRWPVSLTMEAAGFRDSLRQVSPDPNATPAYTWPASYYGHDAKRLRRFDRIDFVWDAGPITPTAAQILGEPGSPYTDIASSPWPSDHRAVVSTFTVQPVPMPALVSVADALVPQGDPVDVTYGARERHDTVDVVPARGAPSSALASFTVTGASGTTSFDSTTLAPGNYDVVLADPGGADLGRVRFTVVTPGAAPRLSLADRTLRGTQPLRVTWRNDPGNRFDWLGIVPAGGGTPRIEPLYGWRYIGAQVDGTAKFGPRQHGKWPLRSGRWSVWLCIDDGYACTAYRSFTIS
jgi:hypothetical protein